MMCVAVHYAAVCADVRDVCADVCVGVRAVCAKLRSPHDAKLVYEAIECAAREVRWLSGSKRIISGSADGT
jgi:hypothetical protein